MSHHYDCDECKARIEGDPLTVSYWQETDDEPEWRDWHLCSWSCVASLGMKEAVEGFSVD